MENGISSAEFEDNITALWRRDNLRDKEACFIFDPTNRLEVFQLIIHNDNPTELFGHVMVNYESDLYNRKCDSPEKFSQTDNCALLIDPDIEVNLNSEFVDINGAVIQVKLNDKLSGDEIKGRINICMCDSDGIILQQNIPSRDVAKIDAFYEIDDGFVDYTSGGNIKWNKPIRKKFSNKFSSFSATLKYALLYPALKAVVEVRLVLKPGRPANVYGSIFGSIHTFDDDSSDKFVESVERTTVTLFKKSRNECIPVEPYELIPLSRRSVAVLDDTSFKVYIKLITVDHNEIVDGVAEFFPRSSSVDCTSNKYIIGEYGEVQVRVILY